MYDIGRIQFNNSYSVCFMIDPPRCYNDLVWYEIPNADPSSAYLRDASEPPTPEIERAFDAWRRNYYQSMELHEYLMKVFDLEGYWIM